MITLKKFLLIDMLLSPKGNTFYLENSILSCSLFKDLNVQKYLVRKFALLTAYIATFSIFGLPLATTKKVLIVLPENRYIPSIHFSCKIG